MHEIKKNPSLFHLFSLSLLHFLCRICWLSFKFVRKGCQDLISYWICKWLFIEPESCNYILPADSFMCQYKVIYRIYNKIIVSNVALIATASAIKPNTYKSSPTIHFCLEIYKQVLRETNLNTLYLEDCISV